jgi:hypothetical protein
VRNLYGAVVAVAACSAAWATPYYVEYQGSSGNFPEAEGWTRYVWGGGDLRYFQDGALVLDAQGVPNTSDSYAWFRPGQLDPGPLEVFVAQWRLRVDSLEVGTLDPTVGVYSDERRFVQLEFSLDGVHVFGEGLVANFAPGVFHDFELRSSSMLTYDLYVDGLLAYSGDFSAPALNASFVVWGDGAIPDASVSSWSSFGFGVIPEPCSAWLLLIASLVRLKPRG